MKKEEGWGRDGGRLFWERWRFRIIGFVEFFGDGEGMKR